jgi:ABC-type multidrug transport system fused ATPase/permease subunit
VAHNTKYRQPRQFQLFLRLLKNITPFWDKYLLIIILLIIQGTIQTLPVLLLSKLPAFIGDGNTVDYIRFCFLLLFPALLFRYVIFDSILYILVWYIGLKLSLKFRMDLYDHMKRLSLRFYQSRPVGEHLYRANADIDALIPLLNSTMSGLPALISNVYQTILMVYLVSIAGSDILFYLTLILIPIYTIVYYLYTFVQNLDYKKRARAQELNSILRESIAGIRVIKAFDRIHHSTRKYYSALVKYLKSTQAAYLLQIAADQIRVSPIHVIWPLSLPLFAWFGLKGRIPVLTWGSIIYFSRAMLYYLDGTYNFFQKIRLYLIPAHRLFETLDLEPEIIEPTSAIRMKGLAGNIEFKDVCFRYEPEKPILEDISFNVDAGEKLGIVGPSGAGKSTIASLLIRLYAAESGTIEIDQQDVMHIRMSSVLEHTGIILQDTFLFGGTIGENIRYGAPDADDARIREAAAAAGIHRDIMDMPGGYDMDVAEGTNLSGGQKQRIAIARAIMKNPRLLILDEATSSLDVETEDAILATLRQNFSDITTVMISHRLSSVADADKIIVIDNGRLSGHGTHSTLIKTNALYRQMFEQQSGEYPA